MRTALPSNHVDEAALIAVGIWHGEGVDSAVVEDRECLTEGLVEGVIKGEPARVVIVCGIEGGEEGA